MAGRVHGEGLEAVAAIGDGVDEAEQPDGSGRDDGHRGSAPPGRSDQGSFGRLAVLAL